MADYSSLCIVTPKTLEEIKASNEAILKVRGEQQKQAFIKRCKTCISVEIQHAISIIGLEETKRIVRELTRELKEI